MEILMKRLFFLLFFALIAPNFTFAQEFMKIKHLGSYHTGIFDEGAAEITAYCPANKTLFFVNAKDGTLEVINISDPTNITFVKSIDLSTWGDVANSVAIYQGIVAVAVQSDPKTDNGKVVFFDGNGNFVHYVTVGALPDMVAFSPNGNYVLACNEGEPNDEYTEDPEGSVSVIDISAGVLNATVATADFNAYDGQENDLRDLGIRIFGLNNPTASKDFEPEYITIDANSQYAYVTLQENNAIAKVDIANAEIIWVKPLGFKDHSVVGNELDASDKDGKINIQNWPVYGMYLPDGITSFVYNGKTYLITANEGDAREYDDLEEDEKVSKLTLDPQAFPNAEELQKDENLGTLKVTSSLGDIDKDGDYDKLYNFGGRSFTIWDDQVNLVWDSGSEFEKKIAQINPTFFNTSSTKNAFDDRSDAKGPEPEDVIVAELNGELYAFIVAERVGGFFVYNVSNPTAPYYVTYMNNRSFTAPFPKKPKKADLEKIGDLGPETIKFISADKSPNGHNLVVVPNEISGSVSVFQIILEPKVNLVNKSTCKNIPVELGNFDSNNKNLSVLYGSGDYTYTWSNSGYLLNKTTSNPIFYNPVSNKTFQLSVKDNETGYSAIGTMTVSVNAKPNFTIPSFVSVPNGTSINLNSKVSNLVGTAPFAYNWTDVTNTEIAEPTLVYPPAGLNKYYLTIADNNGCTSATKRMMVYVPAGKMPVDDDVIVGENGNFFASVYPNVTNGEFNIFAYSQETNNYSIEIFDATGAIIETKNMSINNSDVQFDLSNLPNGLYVVKINNGNDFIVTKIVKMD
jgi:hypothetical protein